MFRCIRCPLDGWKFKWITGDGRFSTRVDSVSSRLAHARAARSAAIEPEHGANGDAEHRAAERVIVREEIAQAVRQREHPLAHGDVRQDVIDAQPAARAH